MKKNQKKAQIILISIGILLILFTYFYNPLSEKKKFVDDKDLQEKDNVVTEESKDTRFENVEYVGLYDLDKKFTVTSEKAHMLNEEDEVVYMTNMKVVLNLKDGRVVNIISKKGKYNKVTYDCFFEENVKATDGATIITSENLDLLATEDNVRIYNNVIVNYPTGTLHADKVDYDFETKYFKVSMYDDKPAKVKVFK